MTLQEPNGGVPTRTRPRRGQLGDLGTLDPQRFHDRSTRFAQFVAVAIEGAQIETVFGVQPVADLGRARRQVGLPVAERMASLHVTLGVLDGGPALGKARGDVQSVDGHQAIRAAAYISASA